MGRTNATDHGEYRVVFPPQCFLPGPPLCPPLDSYCWGGQQVGAEASRWLVQQGPERLDEAGLERRAGGP